MIRILLFILLLIGLGLFIQMTSDIDGQVVVQFYGYEIQTSTQFVFIISIISALFIFFFGQFWAFLVQVPQTFEKWRYTKRYDQGFEYFIESLEFLKSGDIKNAQKLNQKTQKLLPNHNLKNFLAAETSALSEQPHKAIVHYKKLTQNKNSHFLGLSGLIEQYALLEDWAHVQKYAAQAYTQNRKNKFVLESWFQASFYENDTERMLNLLSNIQKHASYTSEFLDQVESFIYIDKALKSASEKETLKLLQKALKVYEYNIPAFELYFQQRVFNVSKRLKMLNEFFKKCPHPQIYNLWLQTVKDEPNKYYKRRLKAFLKGQKNEFITHYIHAHEAYRLDNFLDTIECVEKSEKYYLDSALYKLKLLSLNKLQKSDELATALQIEQHAINFPFKGEESFSFKEKWQNKTIFLASSTIKPIDTKLVTYAKK